MTPLEERRWAREEIREQAMLCTYWPTVLMWAETAAIKASSTLSPIQEREQDSALASALFRRAIELRREESERKEAAA